ncbi:hypothetical protein NXS19_001949 [Fusarium pseudograminearum]|nr:hypothetical protein NXS19_001949 [Fusarium pseudograminearum]
MGSPSKIEMASGSFGVIQRSGLHCSRCYIRCESPAQEGPPTGNRQGSEAFPALICAYMLKACGLDCVLVRYSSHPKPTRLILAITQAFDRLDIMPST